MADTLYNALHSPLCGLPEELLLQIICQLDPTGLQCLKRTSRLFLRLFSDGRFDRYHALSSPASNRALKLLPGPPPFSPRPNLAPASSSPPTPGHRGQHLSINNMKTGTYTARSVHISSDDGRGDSERRIDMGACPTTAIMSSSSSPSPPSCPCVVMAYRRWILVAAEGEECRAVTRSWYEAIDPRSHAGVLLSGDDRSVPFDVLACPGDDRACANYYGYGERPVMKGYGESPRVYEKLIRPSRCCCCCCCCCCYGWHYDLSEMDERTTGNVPGEAPPPVCQPHGTAEGNTTTIMRVVFIFVLVGLLLREMFWWQIRNW